MTTVVKQNGIGKKPATSSPSVKSKLAEEAKGKSTPAPEPKTPVIKLPISLDTKIEQFEKLRGIANQRERVVDTLSNLSKFRYNQGDSAVFKITDSNGLEFTTSNTNLINLVTKEVQGVLTTRKAELEDKILQFKL